ncbi:unnamed protein product, partial [Ectocarpus sp. 12 AP-2014]
QVVKLSCSPSNVAKITIQTNCVCLFWYAGNQYLRSSSSETAVRRNARGFVNSGWAVVTLCSLQNRYCSDRNSTYFCPVSKSP